MVRNMDKVLNFTLMGIDMKENGIKENVKEKECISTIMGINLRETEKMIKKMA